MKLTILSLIIFIGIQIYPKDINYYYDFYNKAQKINDWISCELEFKKAIKEYPEETGFYTVLNYVLRTEKKYTEALEEINTALNKFKDNQDIINNYKYSLTDLGWDYFDKNKIDECYKTFKQLYDYDKEYEWGINAYGFILAQKKEYEKSIAILEYGFKKFPENQYIKSNYQSSILQYAWENIKDNKDLAFNLFKKVYAINPEDQWNINGYGFGLKMNSNYKESIDVLKNGYKKYNDNQYIKGNLIDAYINYANQFRDNNDIKKAFEYMLHAYEIDPNNEWVLLNYAYLYRQSKDFSTSINMYAKGENLYPENKYFKDNIKYTYYDYGLSYYNNKDYNNSLKIFLKASQLYPDEYWYLYYICDINIKINKLDEASNLLLKISNKNLNSKLIYDGDVNIDNNLCILLNLICYKYSAGNEYNKAFKLIDDIEESFKLKFYLCQMRANTLYFSGQKEEGINLSYKAYDLFAVSLKNKINSVVVSFPLKGIYLVGGNYSRSVITHSGLNQYCFDFVGATREGFIKKDKTNNLGKSNDEYIGFGNKIYSPVSGEVIELTNNMPDILPSENQNLGDGNYVAIKGEDGYIYLLVHNMQNSAKVKIGDKVKTGDLLALIGNTGMTTIPHLHFGVYTSDWLVSIPVIFKEYFLIDKDGLSKKISEGAPLDKNLIEIK